VKVIKGLHVGKTVTPHQFCNDWVTVKELAGEVFSPLMLRLETATEWDFFKNDPNPGEFWSLFEIARDGCFVRKVTRGG
jgi:hypothetical protein